MLEQDSTGGDGKPSRPQWDRQESAVIVASFEQARRRGVSQRQFAEAMGVPRTTLQHWLARKAGLDADPVLVAFFEDPVGLAFLHRLVAAVHFQFGQVGLAGVDQVCAFLEISGLSAFVAASHGAQHAVAAAMAQQIVAFGEDQRAALGAAMAPRRIAVCEDETFHPEVCLVAIEPSSGFILLEQYADDREAATWTAALTEATRDLPVEVAVCAGDEASGLLAHSRAIGAQHAPDLFHVQHALWQAMARPLARSLEAPGETLAAAERKAARWQAQQASYQAGPRPPGRPPNFDQHIAEAQIRVAAAEEAHAAVAGRRDETHAAIRQIGQAYHVVDPATGALRDADTVARDLDQAVGTITAAADVVGLSDKGHRLLDKARRVLPKMVATIAFFHAQLATSLAALALSDTLREHVRTVLIPAAYLARLAERAPSVAERAALLAVRQQILASAHLSGNDLACLQGSLRPDIDRLVAECLDLFVRATSCVEGRNGRLALWHHHLHRLSDDRLAVLTTIHNYYIRRPDESTAAERFFGAHHDDLFLWLLDRIDLPARPRSPRQAAAA